MHNMLSLRLTWTIKCSYTLSLCIRENTFRISIKVDQDFNRFPYIASKYEYFNVKYAFQIDCMFYVKYQI